MPHKAYRFHCEICGWTLVSKSRELPGATPVALADVPRGVPNKDHETGAITAAAPLKRAGKFKCPGCGRIVSPKQIADPQADLADRQQAQAKREKLDEESRPYGYQAGAGGFQVP